MSVSSTRYDVKHRGAAIRLKSFYKESKINVVRERGRSALLMSGIKDKDIRKYISLSYKVNNMGELHQLIRETMFVVDDTRRVFWGLPRKFGEGGFLVYGPDGGALDIEPSLEVMNHSPTGFAWGYNGSGPAQLALAILMCLISTDEAVKKYHFFKDQFIATNPMDDVIILYEDDIVDWITNQG